MADDKQLEIGKINLDLTYYPGEDLYCDGEIEDRLLHIARDFSPVEFPGIVEKEQNWEVLYHFSKERENIVEWLPITKDMKVLEVGSGCGAITGALAEKAAEVTCIDLSLKRSKINAYRHMGADNISIHVGNFQDVEPALSEDYDLICLIGVFEYGQAYIQGDAPFVRFLQILQRHLKPDGRIVIAIENRTGMKYFAGCKEDHLGTYFSGLEDYPDGGVVRTFSRTGLEKILAECGVEEYSFYYPYPDYKLMTTLYSDKRLPKVGELSSNMRNFDRDRVVLFDEKRVFDSMIREGLFPVFSNSYLLVIGKDYDISYVKYSSDRSSEYQIKTEQRTILRPGYEQTGERDVVIRKYPLTEAAFAHVRQIDVAGKLLKDRYSGSELKINRSMLLDIDTQLRDGDDILEKQVKPFVEFEYVSGKTLEEIMDAALFKKDMDGFMALFDRYLELLSYHAEKPVADYDMIFSNILVGIKDPHKPFDPLTNSAWTLIDYEWTFGKAMDPKELAFRAIYCYILENEKRSVLKLSDLMEKIGVSDKEAAEYREQELSFQRFVTGGRRSMREMRDLIGHKCHTPLSWIETMDATQQKGRIQVYEDLGNGFLEEESYFPDAENRDGEKITLSLFVKPGTRALRIDPGYADCMLTLCSLSFNEISLAFGGKESRVQTNGTRLDDTNSYVFATKDPGIMISLDNLSMDEVNVLEIGFERAFLTEDMARHMQAAAVKKLRFS